MNKKALGLAVFCVAAATLAASAPAHAAAASHCVVLEVATWDNRVHIQAKCDYDGVAPPYLAVESNSPMAATAIQVGLFALTNKRFVNLFWDQNAGANPAGCNQNDCRRLIGMTAR